MSGIAKFNPATDEYEFPPIPPDPRAAEILRLRAQVEALLKLKKAAENVVYFYADSDLEDALITYTAWETANAKG